MRSEQETTRLLREWLADTLSAVPPPERTVTEVLRQLPGTTQREPLTRGANLKWSEQEDFHLTASRYCPRRDRTTGRTGRTGARLASR